MVKDGAAKPIELAVRGEIVDWLVASGGSLAVTTYNAGKLAIFSAPYGQLETAIWKFPRPMGMAVDGARLAIAFRERIAVFHQSPGEVASATGEVEFTLEHQYHTGRLDSHDLAFANNRLYFANTRFNCLARPSDRVNFLRCWQPPFITEMIAADCCHLNGIGVRNGRPLMITAFGEIDRPRGWRDLDRFSSGVVIDVRKKLVVVRGLNMPHSPRWHAGRWWLCDSGAGVLATFNPETGACHDVAALPGFTRGLCFVGDHALVGTSRIRRRHILDWPPLRTQHAAVRAGVSLINCRNGQELGSLEFIRGGSEVYEVAFLPHVRKAEFRYPPTLASGQSEATPRSEDP